VSPVIGVILVVAITVILAAVIGSSIFGIGGDIERQNIVSATASQPSPDRIVVTYYGGPDHNSVESITVTVNGLQVDDDSDDNNTSAIADVVPGYSLTISDSGDTVANNGIANLNDGTLTITSGDDHVTVAAKFTDGSDWVILDTYV